MSSRLSPVYFATSSVHKLEEAQRLLKLWQVLGLPNYEAPEEDGKSLQENAEIKLQTARAKHPDVSIILAEDTGLFVEALEGAPGVHTARYAGNNASEAANIAKLLANLDGITQRKACFRTVIALYCATNGEGIETFEATCTGHISLQAHAGSGFGYDPVFVPEGFDSPFSALGATQKDQCSHRQKALAQVKICLSLYNSTLISPKLTTNY